MPELARFYGIIISIYFREHGVPHIHASHGNRRRPEWEVALAIRDGRILYGEIPSTELQVTREWMRLHRNELLDAWEAVSEHRKPRKIDPPRMS
jgi:hypothetical protein